MREGSFIPLFWRVSITQNFEVIGKPKSVFHPPAGLLVAPVPGSTSLGFCLQLSWLSALFQDIDLNHYRIGKIEGFEVLKKVKVRGLGDPGA